MPIERDRRPIQWQKESPGGRILKVLRPCLFPAIALLVLLTACSDPTPTPETPETPDPRTIAATPALMPNTPEPTAALAATATQTGRTTRTQWEDAHDNSIPIISAPASLMQDFKTLPQSVQDFVNRSEAIVIGTVTAISEPVIERPYNFDPAVFAGVPESDWPSIVVAYWTINIEQVLLNDGNIVANPKLRMEPNPPHRTDQPHPELSGRYLFALGRNPDSMSYGITADWMILNLSEALIKDIDGKAPAFIEGAQEATLVKKIKVAAGNHEYLPPSEWPSRSDSGQAGAGDPFEPYDDGFGIMRDAQTAKPQSFRTGDGWFAFNLATNLAQM